MKTLITSVVTLGAVLSLFAVQAFAGVEEGRDREEQAFVLYLPNTVDQHPAIMPEEQESKIAE